MKLVSIIIPCYNGEKYIDECFEHILNQTYKNIELIVTNDGSTDNSLEILNNYKEKFKEKNIKYIVLTQENQGIAVSINKCLERVTGDYLVWQDIDDYYEYDAIENMINFMTKNDYKFIRGESYVHIKENNETILRKSKFPKETNIFEFYLMETDAYMFPGIFMVEMNYFDKYIPNRKIYETRAGQNWQLILPLSYNKECHYLNKPVYNYNIIKNSHSHTDKTTKDILKRAAQHKKILLKTIKNIEMAPKEKIKYKKMIKEKYKNKNKIIKQNNPNYHKIRRTIKKIIKKILHR